MWLSFFKEKKFTSAFKSEQSNIDTNEIKRKQIVCRKPKTNCKLEFGCVCGESVGFSKMEFCATNTSLYPKVDAI